MSGESDTRGDVITRYCFGSRGRSGVSGVSGASDE